MFSDQSGKLKTSANRSIPYSTLKGEKGNITCEYSVDFCPVCNTFCEPRFHSAYAPDNGSKKIWLIFQCPSHICQNIFIAEMQPHGDYRKPDFYVLKDLNPKKFKGKTFSTELAQLSLDFPKIYNQAESAEKLNLDQICGPGYRKALEFLIKDYCIMKNGSESEKIRVLPLSQCINEFISNEKIKNCAKFAVWLGNDETHYERKWTTKDIRDLKVLIQLSANFIESEMLAEKYLNEMKKE